MIISRVFDNVTFNMLDILKCNDKCMLKKLEKILFVATQGPATQLKDKIHLLSKQLVHDQEGYKNGQHDDSLSVT